MIRRCATSIASLCVLSACATARMDTARDIAAIVTSPRARTDIIGVGQCVGSFAGLYDVAGQIRAVLAQHQATARLDLGEAP